MRYLLVAEYYVDENGKTNQVKINKSSQNQTFDKQVMDAIYAMPIWKPAENKEGKKVWGDEDTSNKLMF